MAAGQGAVLLNTVDQNKSKYSKCDYTRALLTLKIQYRIYLPRHRHLVKIVENKVQILNFPLNQDEKNLGCLKLKSPRQKYHT